MYSPTLGGFVQTDPIGYADGMNWHNYVGGDPVNRIDPTGMDKDDIVVTGIKKKAQDAPTAPIGGNGGSLGGASGSSNRGGGSKPRSTKNRICEFGNGTETLASAAGDASLNLFKAGAVVGVAGIATGQSGIITAGVGLLDLSGTLGVGAAVAQVGGGFAQVVGGGRGGVKNILGGALSFGTGVLISKAFEATTPRGWHGSTLSSAQTTNRVVGNVVGVLQGLADFLAPEQVKCPD